MKTPLKVGDRIKLIEDGEVYVGRFIESKHYIIDDNGVSLFITNASSVKRLIKKPRRRVWVNVDRYKLFISDKTVPPLNRGWKEFIEAKPKGEK